MDTEAQNMLRSRAHRSATAGEVVGVLMQHSRARRRAGGACVSQRSSVPVKPARRIPSDHIRGSAGVQLAIFAAGVNQSINQSINQSFIEVSIYNGFSALSSDT